MPPKLIANLVVTLVAVGAGIWSVLTFITSCSNDSGWKEEIRQEEKKAEDATTQSFLNPEKIGYIKGMGDCYRVRVYSRCCASHWIYYVPGHSTEATNFSNGKANGNVSSSFIK